ncbi:MAG TPA: Na+/H+ antiporter subunit D [Kiritimatiellia bacterium]|nr:Na+/H+ antiporter subunit D [Kiritimatiellia bacterium]
MNALVISPVLIPLLTAILALLFWRWRNGQRAIAILGMLLLFLASLRLLSATREQGILVLQLGNWPAPFGISFVVDLLSAIMLVFSSLVALGIAIYSLGANELEREKFGYYPLLAALIMGVNGAFLTGDIFNLYVWFEVMLMASFVLLTLGGEKAQIEGGVKYVALNFLASAIFLAAVGLLYGTVGTLNMADLAVKIRDAGNLPLLSVIALLFLTAFGIKAAVFPMFFWLPASYPTPPPAVSALFSGLLSKVGVYALIRVFTLIFALGYGAPQQLLLILGGITMLVGVLGAAAQFEIRRILSFHIISQIGYMIMGLGIYTPLALAGAVFFIVHNMIVKSNLFLIGGIIHYLRGTGELKRIGGFYRSRPAMAIMFLISAMALAGLPPFSGFFGKLVLVLAAVRAESYLLVGVALGAGLLTLFSMTKIWSEAFWKDSPEPEIDQPRATPVRTFTMMIPVALFTAFALGLGLAFGPVFRIMMEAGHQLMDPSLYIRAVLGDAP